MMFSDTSFSKHLVMSERALSVITTSGVADWQLFCSPASSQLIYSDIDTLQVLNVDIP